MQSSQVLYSRFKSLRMAGSWAGTNQLLNILPLYTNTQPPPPLAKYKNIYSCLLLRYRTHYRPFYCQAVRYILRLGLNGQAGCNSTHCTTIPVSHKPTSWLADVPPPTTLYSRTGTALPALPCWPFLCLGFEHCHLDRSLSLSLRSLRSWLELESRLRWLIWSLLCVTATAAPFILNDV